MEKEFNLSEKIQILKAGAKRIPPYLIVDLADIKEFIKGRNKLDNDLRNNRITWAKFLDKRRKLAGPKFIQNEKTNCYY